MSNDSSPNGDPVEPTEPIPTATDPAVPPTTAMPVAAGATPPPPTGTDPNHAIPQDPPPPWYRENPAAAAVIVLGLIGIFALIAWLIWGGDDDDDALIIDSSTTLEVIDDDDITLGTVDTEPVDTTAPSSTAPPTTEPITTSVPAGGTAPLNTTTTTTTTTTTVAATTTTAAASTTVAATTTTTPNVTSPPNPDATVLDVINDSPDLSELRALIAQAGLEESLAGADPLTVFAPSNPAIEAFAATPEGAAILADPAQLEQLLLRHVAPGALDGQAVLAAEEIETASGDLLAIDADAMTVDGGELLVTDVSASNGFVHVVDRVLAAR